MTKMTSLDASSPTTRQEMPSASTAAIMRQRARIGVNAALTAVIRACALLTLSCAILQRIR